MQSVISKQVKSLLGDRVIVDAIALGPDNVFDAAGEVDVRASEVNLERAVLALGEEGIA